ncbi:response regulator receiver modulated FAD- dependent pyridine nucleotide-disulfide oxidoreductase [Flammeovirgaceae bacterium 311]|nr:response regulator receiver modulated FAD- dependent pyridine nucleotide-disulfide oxidoreductase [Flammeovirgaceae bacterium 311]
MKQPIILALDDDEQVLRAVARDLRKRYKDYRIISTESAGEALEALEEIKKKKHTIALFVVDQRMPEMLGVDFLKKALPQFPDAKRVLLTAYSDTEAAIRAINEVKLDYYFVKPWDPPEEKLYPVLDGLLEDWQSSYRPPYQGIQIIGYQFSPKSHELKDFLAGNLVPYKWLDAESSKKARQLIEEHGCGNQQLPLVIFNDGSGLCNPDPKEVAKKIGLQLQPNANLYDVVIVGGGPAGLAAAVYGASEGLRTLLIEKRAPGGQAGTSSRIENYLGFPNGLSGAELTRRAVSQATRFGTEILAPQEVAEIEVQEGGYKLLTLSDGSEVKTRSVIITTGVDYKKLMVDGLEAYNGAGVYYGAAMTEANSCSQRKVFIVGGGNSAGQAAVYLSGFAKEVVILIRNESLEETMSHYLIEQLDELANVQLWPHTEVVGAEGEDKLEKLHLYNNQRDEKWKEEAEALFIFIGASPYTAWLPINILKNEEGYIETGADLKRYKDYSKFWKEDRDPFLLETCGPGIFAAGDVRAGAMNRIASAVGEGAMAIKFVHQYLSDQ